MNNIKHKTTHNIKRVNFDTSMVLNYIDQHPHQLPVSSSPTTSKTHLIGLTNFLINPKRHRGRWDDKFTKRL